MAGWASADQADEDGLQLLHVAARLVRPARRTLLRFAATWPWAGVLAAAYTRLAALPRPIG